MQNTCKTYALPKGVVIGQACRVHANLFSIIPILSDVLKETTPIRISINQLIFSLNIKKYPSLVYPLFCDKKVINSKLDPNDDDTQKKHMNQSRTW